MDIAEKAKTDQEPQSVPSDVRDHLSVRDMLEEIVAHMLGHEPLSLASRTRGKLQDYAKITSIERAKEILELQGARHASRPG